MILRVALLLVLPAWLALAGTGCSGINASPSVSPATFLIPGFFGHVPASRIAAPQPVNAAPAPDAVPAFSESL